MKMYEIAMQEIRKQLDALQPVAGRFSKYEAPFLLFALDAYREEIVKRIPEAETVKKELERMFGTATSDEFINADGKMVRYTFKKGLR